MAEKIPQSFIDDLVDRIDLVDWIGSHIALKKTGSNYTALCPFHDEKTPSFSVNPKKQFYHCFGCGASGDALTFTLEYERLSFHDAVEKLAKRCGVSVPKTAVTPKQQQQQQRRKNLYTVCEEAKKLFQSQLHQDNQKAKKYLASRGISQQVYQQFEIGYAPHQWRFLLDSMGSSGEVSRLIEAGLVVNNQENGKVYDRFRDRLIFPIIDHRGRTIGFGGRVFNDDKPKYINSPETPIFSKQRELYGLYQAMQSQRQLKALIVVEGYMDVVALAQAGVSNAVATLGTAIGALHLEKIFRTTQEVVFCFDGDEAGKKAAERALTEVIPFMESGRQAKFLSLPVGEDPDSWIKRVGKDQWHHHVMQAPSFSEHLFAWASDGLHLQRSEDKGQLLQRIMPRIQAMPDGSLKMLMLQSLQETLGLSSQQLHALTPQSIDALDEKNIYKGTPSYADFNQVSRTEPDSCLQVVKSPIATLISLLIIEPAFAELTPSELYETATDNVSERLLVDMLMFIKSQDQPSSARVLGFAMSQHEKTLRAMMQNGMPIENISPSEEEYHDACEAILAKRQQLASRMTLDALKEQAPNKTFDQLDETQKKAFLALFNSSDGS